MICLLLFKVNEFLQYLQIIHQHCFLLDTALSLALYADDIFGDFGWNLTET